jgi:hypothetical protein
MSTFVYFVNGSAAAGPLNTILRATENSDGTWAAPTAITIDGVSNPSAADPNVLVLPDGNFLLTYTLFGSPGAATTIETAISADGIHFTGSQPAFTTPAGQSPVDPSVVQLPDGAFLMTAESLSDGTARFYTSTDGRSFTATGVTLPNLASPDLAVLPNGDLRLFTTGIASYISHDNGQTWTQEDDLRLSTGSFVADPSVVQTPSGLWEMVVKTFIDPSQPMSGPMNHQLSLAISADGVNFTVVQSDFEVHASVGEIVVAGDSAPVLSAIATHATLQPGTPVQLAPDLLIADPDGLLLVGATVAVTAGTFLGDGDTLTADTAGTAVTATYDSDTEMLTLSGIDTAIDYQHVLASVSFDSGPDADDAGAQPARTITWTLDGALPENPGVAETVSIMPDAITGTDDDNTLTGSAGDDTLQGLGGDDTIDGGAGVDTSVYAGARSEYFVHTALVEGVLVTTVTDQGGAGDGTDTLTSIEALRFSDGAFALAGADLNRVSNFDGHAYDDVMLQVNGTGQLVFANMEAGQFTGFGVLTSPLPGVNPVGHADMDGDGIADVIVQIASNDQVLIGFQDGSGSGSPHWVSASSALKGGGADFQAVGVGDINGDALPDIILQNEGATGDGRILAITGQVSPGVPDITTVSGPLRVDGVVDFRVVGVGDVNGDGFADIVLQNQLNGGQVLVDDFHNNGFFTLATATGPFQVVGVGDINGDGHADVILQQAGGGDVIYLDSTGGFNDFKLAVAGIGSFIAKGVADVNNDGFAEILLENPVTGEVDFRHVGAFDADGAFGAVISPNGGALHLV